MSLREFVDTVTKDLLGSRVFFLHQGERNSARMKELCLLERIYLETLLERQLMHGKGSMNFVLPRKRHPDKGFLWMNMSILIFIGECSFLLSKCRVLMNNNESGCLWPIRCK